MFFTLQFPFADVRSFLLHHPQTVLPKIIIGEPFELKERAKEGFVRSFGRSRPRGYVPNFKGRVNHDPPPNGKYKSKYWEKLSNLWSEEYCYFDAHRGLLFKNLEKQILSGKLCYPRAKVRALHLSRYDPGNALWSPSMRIETGVYFVNNTAEPLDGDEVGKVIVEFLKLPTIVPVYQKWNTISSASTVTKKFVESPLIEQKSRLAQLILQATTIQSELRTHQEMIIPGEPLLAVHYFPDELSRLPPNVDWLPSDVAEGVSIGYLPLRTPWGPIGTWLFELPSTKTRRERREAVNQRRIIRNYTIAIMRYWSELRTALLIGRSLLRGGLSFSATDTSLLQEYLNKVSRFLFTHRWHGASLRVVRSVINAYEDMIEEEEMRIADDGLQNLKRQVAQKARRIFNDKGRVGVFVSYSHKDVIWRTEIQEALGALHEQHQIAYFDDTYIEVGEQWLKKILQSIDTAAIAVLLISDHFLSSEFITKKELPRIRELYQRGKLEVIPIWINGNISKFGFWSNFELLKSANGSLENSNTEQIEKAKVALVESVKKSLSMPRDTRT